MSNFQAVVIRPNISRDFGKKGRQLKLRVWIPPIAGDIGIEKFEALQGVYQERLEIVAKPALGRALIILNFLACSSAGVRRTALKLAADIQKHLGVPTTIQ